MNIPNQEGSTTQFIPADAQNSPASPQPTRNKLSSTNKFLIIGGLVLLLIIAVAAAVLVLNNNSGGASQNDQAANNQEADNNQQAQDSEDSDSQQVNQSWIVAYSISNSEGKKVYYTLDHESNYNPKLFSISGLIEANATLQQILAPNLLLVSACKDDYANESCSVYRYSPETGGNNKLLTTNTRILDAKQLSNGALIYMEGYDTPLVKILVNNQTKTLRTGAEVLGRGAGFTDSRSILVSPGGNYFVIHDTIGGRTDGKHYSFEIYDALGNKLLDLCDVNANSGCVKPMLTSDTMYYESYAGSISSARKLDIATLAESSAGASFAFNPSLSPDRTQIASWQYNEAAAAPGVSMQLFNLTSGLNKTLSLPYSNPHWLTDELLLVDRNGVPAQSGMLNFAYNGILVIDLGGEIVAEIEPGLANWRGELLVYTY